MIKNILLSVIAFLTLLGCANPTIMSPEISQSVASSALTPETTKVYVASGGNSEVFWFSKKNLINAQPNVNVDNIVTMSLAEAQAAGKRHSTRESEDTPKLALEEEAPVKELQEAAVVRVIDGDTIVVKIDDAEERVRLIGIDTPENGSPGFQEATDFTKESLGEKVWLESDGRNRDRFDRLRRYVWTTKPKDVNDKEEIKEHMLNARLLEKGHAVVLIISGDNPRHKELFEALATRR